MKNRKHHRQYGFVTIFIFLLFTFTFLLASCNTTAPKPERDVVLKVEDVSSTEAWLKLSLNNFTAAVEVQLKRNGKAVNTFRITSVDTTLYDDSLNPNSTYTYQAVEQQNGRETAKSELVSAVTMDTTSHNFTWQKYTFGGANGSSMLYDVAIINDSDIWAVGEIHTKDTDQWNADSTKWIDPYNAVHWNGQKWELKRIYVNYRGQPSFAPLKGVFALPGGKIIFSSGLPYLPEGDHWKLYHLWDMGILNKNDGSVYSIWGTSINNLYFAGNKGTIVHYNGSKWTKIESPAGGGVNVTGLDINDIWGDYDAKTGKWEILAVASNMYSSFDRSILSIDPIKGEVTMISSQPINGTLSSVWFKSNKKYYVTGGAGNFEKHNLSDTNWKNSFVSKLRFSILRVRANGLNDVFGAGGGGEVLHFNGITTKSYYNTTRLSNGNYYSITVKDNLCVAVGENNPKAVLVIGRR